RAQADLRFERRAGPLDGAPAGEQSGQVVGMHRSLPAPAARAVGREPGELGPALIYRIDLPLRVPRPPNPANPTDHAAKIAHHCRSLAIAVCQIAQLYRLTSMALWCWSEAA